MTLLREIEKFLREQNMPWTKFGRLSVRDPRFVADLRNGREPGSEVCQRVQQFMNIWRQNHAA